MSIATITPPSVEPVTMTEAKRHLRLTTDDHNLLIERLLKAARRQVEANINRALIQRTLEMKFNDFTDDMQLWYPPLQSVTSVKYIDTAGVEQTLSTDVYDVDTASEPGRITLAYNQSWPSIRDQVDAVIIRYVAGYDTAGTSPDDYTANIPPQAIMAILLLIGHWFRHAEAVTDVPLMPTPMAFDAVLASLRIWHF
jgi:uncharacterized phiE125 gp8 family phage protein